jgi:hypothetical protein
VIIYQEKSISNKATSLEVRNVSDIRAKVIAIGGTPALFYRTHEENGKRGYEIPVTSLQQYCAPGPHVLNVIVTRLGVAVKKIAERAKEEAKQDAKWH